MNLNKCLKISIEFKALNMKNSPLSTFETDRMVGFNFRPNCLFYFVKFENLKPMFILIVQVVYVSLK